MKVHELVKWLAAFKDQDADVLVVRHTNGTGYYDQGGNSTEVTFQPDKYAEYTDMRGNPHVPPGATYENSRTLLLGELNA